MCCNSRNCCPPQLHDEIEVDECVCCNGGNCSNVVHSAADSGGNYSTLCSVGDSVGDMQCV